MTKPLYQLGVLVSLLCASRAGMALESMDIPAGALAGDTAISTVAPVSPPQATATLSERGSAGGDRPAGVARRPVPPSSPIAKGQHPPAAR